MNVILNRFDFFVKKIKRDHGNQYIDEIFYDLGEIRCRIKQLLIIKRRISRGIKRHEKIDIISAMRVGDELTLDYESFAWVASRILKLISRINGHKIIENSDTYKEIMRLRNNLIEHSERKDGVRERSFAFKEKNLFYKPLNFSGNTIRYYDRGFLRNWKDLLELLLKVFGSTDKGVRYF